MPFCPKCKNEYRPGIKVCSDCKVDLVDDLNHAPVVLARGIEESLKEILAFCQSKGLTTGFITYDKKGDTYELYCDKKDVEGTIPMLQAFQAKKQMEYLAEKNEIPMEEMTPQLAKELIAQEMEAAKEAQKIAKGRSVVRSSYVDKRERAEEYKSSGFVLTAVGIVGLIVLVCMYMGVIPGFESLRRNYMFLGVMGALFVVFIVVGLMSFTKIKSIIGQAEADEDLTARVKEFMEKNITKEVLDRVASGGVGEEELFFQRAEYMEKALKNEFPEMEDALCEKLIDERYSELYENNDR